MEVILLDSRVRDWVVLPMIVLMTLVGVGRSLVQQLIKSEPEMDEKEFSKIRHKQTVARGDRLRMVGAHFINKNAFSTRKTYLCEEEKGLLHEKVPGPNMNPMSNPNMMMDMFKGQLSFMLPNFVLMNFINNFFSGFVCLKVPFSMPSNHFKTMLQRGVDLKELDVSYVSSISWYIILTFGLSGVYRLILDEGMDVDPMEMQKMQMTMGMGGMGGGPGGQFDAKGAYKGCRDMLAITRNDFDVQSVEAEQKLLGDKYPVAHADKVVDLSKFR